MVSALVSAAVAAGTAIYGGIQKSNAARRQKRAEQAELDRQRAENANWYNRNRYEDPLQNAYYQAAINGTRQTFLDSLKSLSGRNAVMGGSNASVAAAKEKASNAMATMNANIAARGAARQQQVEDAYLRNETSISERQRATDRYFGEAQQQAITDAVTGLGGAAASAIGTFAKNGEAVNGANGSNTTITRAANQVNSDDIAKAATAYNVDQTKVAETAKAMAANDTVGRTATQVATNAGKMTVIEQMENGGAPVPETDWKQSKYAALYSGWF